jgi:hypothetical protein
MFRRHFPCSFRLFYNYTIHNTSSKAIAFAFGEHYNLIISKNQPAYMGGLYWHSEPISGNIFKPNHWPVFDVGRLY